MTRSEKHRREVEALVVDSTALDAVLWRGIHGVERVVIKREELAKEVFRFD